MTSATFNGARVKSIFFPYMDQKIREVNEAGNRFVYYTTADTATSILRKQQIWMRNTMTMNDYKEVDHGIECLNSAILSEPNNIFNRSIDACFTGLSEDVKNNFKAWLPGIRRDTYITCVSEHSAEEDELGRLSMWRAYGGQAGVALVLNGAVMLNESDALAIYSSPVAYLGSKTFAAEVVKVARNIENEVEYIRSLDRETVKNIVFNMFRFAVLCTKHPGFHEEREWRVVASPVMHSEKLPAPTIEIVRGTPQKVLKIDLQNRPDQGLVGLSLPELLNRIIIGPCEFPQVMWQAFVQLLVEAGVPEPASKIVISDIPLRQA